MLYEEVPWFSYTSTLGCPPEWNTAAHRIFTRMIKTMSPCRLFLAPQLSYLFLLLKLVTLLSLILLYCLLFSLETMKWPGTMNLCECSQLKPDCQRKRKTQQQKTSVLFWVNYFSFELQFLLHLCKGVFFSSCLSTGFFYNFKLYQWFSVC